MTGSQLLMCAPFLALLVWAAVEDLYVRRIRNWLTFGLLLAGLCQSLLGGDLATVSFAQSILGILAGAGLTFILFGLGALGAGDVKLLGAVGAWLGPTNVLLIFIAEALIGLVIVLIQAAAAGRLRELFRNSAVIAVNLAHVNDLGLAHVTETSQSATTIGRPLPYAVPVLLATVLVMYLKLGG